MGKQGGDVHHAVEDKLNDIIQPGRLVSRIVMGSKGVLPCEKR